MKNRQIVIQIRKLVVEGFGGKDASRIVDSVERELTRRFEGQGEAVVAARAGEPVRLQVGITAARGAQTIGGEIAAAVHQTATGADWRRKE